MTSRVKICGITNMVDALTAVEAGADALGFIFVPGSPRRLQFGEAARIAAAVPPFVSRVGVFVNEAVAKIGEAVHQVGMDTVQLHGEERPEDCDALREMGLRVIKAFRVKDRSSLAGLENYRVSGFLLDSYVPGQLGGTGALFNWDLAVEAKQHRLPIILAGGLTPGNVADAVMKVRPFAVDVSTGVEESPGKKDPAKVREFIARAKGSH